MSTGVKSEGTVKFFNPSKGYGFITKDDGQDVFVHATDLDQDIVEGQVVYFDEEETERGVKAVNVE